MKDLLLSLASYNYWANQRLMDAIENSLDEKQLDQTIVSSFDSIRKTIYHLWDAENIWLRRWNNVPIDGWPSRNFSGNITTCKNELLGNSKALLEYISDHEEEELKKTFSFKLMNGTEGNSSYWESVQHIFNHSTFHRGQLVTMLRQVGITEIPQTDYIAYVRTKK